MTSADVAAAPDAAHVGERAPARAEPAPGPGVLATLTPFLSAMIVLAFSFVLYGSAREHGAAAALVEHTHDVIEENDALLARLIDAETGERGFIMTGDPVYLAPYQDAQADVARHLATLGALTRDNAGQQERLDTLRALVDRRFTMLANRVSLRRRVGFDSSRADFVAGGGGRPLMDSARAEIAAIDRAEQRLLESRIAAQARRERGVVLVAVIGAILAAVLAFIINAWLSRAVSREARLGRALREHAADLEQANQQLEDQASALEEQASELEEQAAELEVVNDELNATNVLLEERTAEAESANAAKAQFLANMSHDLRTPLNAVIGYVDLLRAGVHGPLAEEQENALARIARSSAHLRLLIGNVLDIAKIDAGGMQLQLEQVPLAEVIDGVQPLVSLQARAKGVTLGYACDQGLVLYADRDKVDQILVNLIGNAIKFTEPGGRIDVRCCAADERVHVDVVDTGCGIPADQLESVFEPFVQLAARREPRDVQGTGLGLAIARRLARAMDGDVVVQSAVGTGSTFSLHLPGR